MSGLLYRYYFDLTKVWTNHAQPIQLMCMWFSGEENHEDKSLVFEYSNLYLDIWDAQLEENVIRFFSEPVIITVDDGFTFRLQTNKNIKNDQTKL